MFNLLVRSGGWGVGGRVIFDETRVFEYTSDDLRATFGGSGRIDFSAIIKFPTLFMGEIRRGDDQYAHVGKVHDVTRNDRGQLVIDYTYNQRVAPISLEDVVRIQHELGFSSNFEFSRTHWALKSADLYQVIVSDLPSRHRHPHLFRLPMTPIIEEALVAVMMPFNGFADVYRAIGSAVSTNEMRCNRADDIWNHDAIMDDVVNLIDRSAMVICDCTGRNPNVFYEIGLAHAWGKQVILITQNPNDIPFDLAHIRHIRYLANSEGLADLEQQLTVRIRSIRSGL